MAPFFPRLKKIFSQEVDYEWAGLMFYVSLPGKQRNIWLENHNDDDRMMNESIYSSRWCLIWATRGEDEQG